MKTKTFFLISLLLLLSDVLGAQNTSGLVTSHFKVYGNCKICKKRIETALDYKGIKEARWNVKTKELQVKYNPGKISEPEIHQLIAKAGHDTDQVKASDEVYASLPFCCLYREGEMSEQQHQP